MWGAVCGKTARTVLRRSLFQLLFKKGEVNLLMNSSSLIKCTQRAVSIVLAFIVAASCLMIANVDNSKAAGAGASYKKVINKIKRNSREVYYRVSDIDRDNKKELLISNKAEGSGFTLSIYKKRKGKIKRIFCQSGYTEKVFVYKKGKIIVTYMCSHANEMYEYFKKKNRRYKRIGYKKRYSEKAGGWDTPWEYYYLDNLVEGKDFNKKVGKKAKGKRKVYKVFKWKHYSNY